jgi:hypothetical protein
LPCLQQGCQMVCFQNKNPNLGKLWRVLQWKMLFNFMDTWSILCMVFCYILWIFGVVRGISPFWYCVPRKIWQPWSSYLHFFPSFSREKNVHKNALPWN